MRHLLPALLLLSGCVGRVVVDDQVDPATTEEAAPPPEDAGVSCCVSALAPAAFCDGEPAPGMDLAGLPVCP